MRQIALRRAGDCEACGEALAVGALAWYERRCGVYCDGCQPTDPEELRAVREAGAARKAERLEGWAAKREARAEAQLTSLPQVRHDWAFITQPGRIPMRDRMNKADAKACESLQKARDMRQKASSLRGSVRVKGDAGAKREAKREAVRAWIRVGMRVHDAIIGPATVTKVNRVTASVKRSPEDRPWKSDLSFLSRIDYTPTPEQGELI